MSNIDLYSVRVPMIRYLADVTKCYDVRAMRRFVPAKRYTLTACLLVEVYKAILNHIVASHDQLHITVATVGITISNIVRRGILGLREIYWMV